MEDSNILTSRIAIVRNISLFVLVICSIQLIILVALPDALDTTTKSWLMAVVSGILLTLIASTFISRHDPTIMLFINAVSQFFSGIIFGLSLFMILLKVKNG